MFLCNNTYHRHQYVQRLEKEWLSLSRPVRAAQVGKVHQREELMVTPTETIGLSKSFYTFVVHSSGNFRLKLKLVQTLVTG